MTCCSLAINTLTNGLHLAQDQQNLRTFLVLELELHELLLDEDDDYRRRSIDQSEYSDSIDDWEKASLLVTHHRDEPRAKTSCFLCCMLTSEVLQMLFVIGFQRTSERCLPVLARPLLTCLSQCSVCVRILCFL